MFFFIAINKIINLNISFDKAYKVCVPDIPAPCIATMALLSLSFSLVRLYYDISLYLIIKKAFQYILLFLIVVLYQKYLQYIILMISRQLIDNFIQLFKEKISKN